MPRRNSTRAFARFVRVGESRGLGFSCTAFAAGTATAFGTAVSVDEDVDLRAGGVLVRPAKHPGRVHAVSSSSAPARVGQQAVGVVAFVVAGALASEIEERRAREVAADKARPEAELTGGEQRLPDHFVLEEVRAATVVNDKPVPACAANTTVCGHARGGKCRLGRVKERSGSRAAELHAQDSGSAGRLAGDTAS